MAQEEYGNLDKAVEYYTIIKSEYSSSDEARDIDKFINRAELKQ